MFEDILEKTSWERGEKVLLSVIITLNTLADKGILSEGPFDIPDMERALEVVGDVVPTEDEIKEVIGWMKAEGYMG